jgi:drug/metabolite transporter (DMT)-like permease
VPRLAIPALFVVLWSTGFVVARLAAPHADVNLFLALRFVLASACLAALVTVTGRRWPARERLGFHVACGALLNGAYLVGSYWAVGAGLAVGAMALLGAMQPLFTAVYSATVQRAHVGRDTWLGLVVGVIGVALVLLPGVLRGGVGSVAPTVVLAALASVAAITAGTLLQRRHAATDDLLSVSSIQHFGGMLVALAALGLYGELRFSADAVLFGALAWAVLPLSVGATSLFIYMVRTDGATKTTALLLLAPPLAALEAFVAFGETLSAYQLIGFALALVGVLAARRVTPPAIVTAD